MSSERREQTVFRLREPLDVGRLSAVLSSYDAAKPQSFSSPDAANAWRAQRQLLAAYRDTAQYDSLGQLVSYAPKSNAPYGRCYANSRPNGQVLSGALRRVIFGPVCAEVDLHNASPSIVIHELLARRTEWWVLINTTLPRRVRITLDEYNQNWAHAVSYVEDRDTMLAKNSALTGISVADLKTKVTACLFGAVRPFSMFSIDLSLKAVLSFFSLIHKFADLLWPAEYEFELETPSDDAPFASPREKNTGGRVLFRWFEKQERRVMETAKICLEDDGYKIAISLYDGLWIYPKPESEEAINRTLRTIQLKVQGHDPVFVGLVFRVKDCSPTPEELGKFFAPGAVACKQVQVPKHLRQSSLNLIRITPPPLGPPKHANGSNSPVHDLILNDLLAKADQEEKDADTERSRQRQAARDREMDEDPKATADEDWDEEHEAAMQKAIEDEDKRKRKEAKEAKEEKSSLFIDDDLDSVPESVAEREEQENNSGEGDIDLIETKCYTKPDHDQTPEWVGSADSGQPQEDIQALVVEEIQESQQQPPVSPIIKRRRLHKASDDV